MHCPFPGHCTCPYLVQSVPGAQKVPLRRSRPGTALLPSHRSPKLQHPVPLGHQHPAGGCTASGGQSLYSSVALLQSQGPEATVQSAVNTSTVVLQHYTSPCSVAYPGCSLAVGVLCKWPKPRLCPWGIPTPLHIWLSAMHILFSCP